MPTSTHVGEQSGAQADMQPFKPVNPVLDESQGMPPRSKAAPPLVGRIEGIESMAREALGLARHLYAMLHPVQNEQGSVDFSKVENLFQDYQLRAKEAVRQAKQDMDEVNRRNGQLRLEHLNEVRMLGERTGAMIQNARAEVAKQLASSSSETRSLLRRAEGAMSAFDTLDATMKKILETSFKDMDRLEGKCARAETRCLDYLTECRKINADMLDSGNLTTRQDEIEEKVQVLSSELNTLAHNVAFRPKEPSVVTAHRASSLRRHPRGQPEPWSKKQRDRGLGIAHESDCESVTSSELSSYHLASRDTTMKGRGSCCVPRMHDTSHHQRRNARALSADAAPFIPAKSAGRIMTDLSIRQVTRYVLTRLYWQAAPVKDMTQRRAGQ